MSFLRPLRRFRPVDTDARRLLWFKETWDAARLVRQERGLSTLGVLAEQARLYRQYDLDQYTYYWYRLFEKAIPFEEKAQYIPDSVKANARLWRLLTPESYRCLYDNKLVFNRYFAALGFPLAEIFGVYDPQVGFTSAGCPLRSADDLRSWLDAHGDRGFVFKPAEGIQGHHILVFVGRAADGLGVMTLAGERFDAEALAEFTRRSSA